MKIYYEISYRLTRSDLQNYIQTRPGISRSQAITEWLELKYKSWINTAICPKLTDFEFEPNIPQTDEPIAFTVDFRIRDHGETFLAQMGGREL